MAQATGCRGLWRAPAEPGLTARGRTAVGRAVPVTNGAPPSPHEAAVVGSIIFFTSVILVAGKPLISACLRMIDSSLAR
jgi:hypothetical protein